MNQTDPIGVLLLICLIAGTALIAGSLIAVWCAGAVVIGWALLLIFGLIMS